MNYSKRVGIVAAILSAIIFGSTAILVKIAYNGGANSITIVFLRSFLAIPVLLIMLKSKSISLRITKQELKVILTVGIFGATLTNVALYSSYNYISVGMATTLHFIYPVLVTLGCTIFFHEKMTKWKLIALLLSTIGVVLLADKGSLVKPLGLIFGLSSGIFYSFYMICLGKTLLRKMHYFKVTFYICIIIATLTGAWGLGTSTLNLQMTPLAWLCAFLVAMLVSIGALALLQLGIRIVGASQAAILSTLEPITSVLLGVLVLKESFSISKLLACITIILSVILVNISQQTKNTIKGGREL